MAPRATSLGPKPSLFIWFVFFLFFVFVWEGLRVRWGGPKGHLTWPLNPPSVFFVFFSLFSFLCFNRQTPVFPLKKGHFGLFIFVSLCFSLAFFGPPPFSISLSLSLSCYFLSSFLSVSHFCISFLLFLSVDLLFLSSCSFVFSFFSACCLVLFWIIRFDLFLFCILFSIVVVFCFCCFGILLFFDFLKPIKKHLWKYWKLQKKQKWKMQKKKNGHFDKSS